MKNHILSFNRVSFILLFFLIGSVIMLSSCEQDKDVSGTPVISNVRLLDPLKKDSSFTSARPGTLILVEGQNLGGIVNIYFNDYEALFNATYNTNSNLIVTIPSQAPTEATNPNVPNSIRIVTTHGETTMDFVLDIPAPKIDRFFNANALPGDSLTIFGSNLWLIEKVVFPGGKEVKEVTGYGGGSKLQLIMPDLGLESGPISIKAKYGNATSDVPVNKWTGQGVISNLTEDGKAPGAVFNWGWWGANRTANATLFPGNRGEYLQNVFGGVGASDGGWWNGNRSGNFSAAKVVPDLGVLGEPSDKYVLQFEVNTKEDWTTAICVLRFGEVYAYRFIPFTTSLNKIFSTKNKWQTITIPLSEFKTKAKNDKNQDVEGIGTSARTLGDLLTSDGKAAFGYRFISENDPIVLFNSAFDNIRIVKKQ